MSKEDKVMQQIAQMPHSKSEGFIIPNHSGITGNLDAKNKLDARYINSTEDLFLKNSEVDVGVGLTLTGDNSSADTAYVPMVLYNTDATPPAASGFPIGTIYIQYTP